MKTRCSWAESNELLKDYHDKEWGRPVHNDQKLFEMLNLEGAQAGLSWLTVLQKRAHYRKVFDNFDAQKMAKYNTGKKLKLLKDPGIIRNRLKINAFVENAKAFLIIQKEFGSFSQYIWSFAEGKTVPKQHGIAISEKLSQDLKKRGFRFIGPTICYAFMQATGLVNDHSPSCFLSPKR